MALGCFAAESSNPKNAAEIESKAVEFAKRFAALAKPDSKLSKEYEAFCSAAAAMGPDALSAAAKCLSDSDPGLRAVGGDLLLASAKGATAQGNGGAPADTDALGKLAATYFCDPDPFLAAIAEWAVALRMGRENEAAFEKGSDPKIRAAKKWPGEDGKTAPDWFVAWSELRPETYVQNDHARQAVALGFHRSPGLMKPASAEAAARVTAMAAYYKASADPATAAEIDTAAATFRSTADKLKAALESRGDAVATHKAWLQLRAAQREFALTNPDLGFQKIVFATRRGDGGGGNITFGRWLSAPPGGDIYVKTGFSPADPAKPLIDNRLGPGHVRGLELWFDADRMVFAYGRQPEKTDDWEMASLYEMNVDGSSLRQLTGSKYNADQEPTYLPNGDIVFVSDRSGFGSQCAGELMQDNLILNLFRCDKDGKNIRAISNNKDFDRHPHIMDEGQILYLHWEYLDRHLWQTHTLWSARPDGTQNDALFKQHITTGPMSLREARQIPGTNKLVAIGCGHHNSDVGAVYRVEYAKGINDATAMEMVTPNASSTEGGYGDVSPVTEGAVKDNGGFYRFPYPLSEKSFLVSYTYGGLYGFGLYYIDVWGNKELIHRDPRTSVAFLSPVKARTKPQVIADTPEIKQDGERYAKVFMQDVYASMTGVERGTIKYLRLAQPMPWPAVKDEKKASGYNDLHYMSTTGWTPAFGMWGWGASRAVGIVPVEDDGSAYFMAPADHPVHFQALDKDFREVRRMRSYVTFFNGETRGCIGCHETKSIAPELTSVSGKPKLKALLREASRPVPPLWGDRELPDFEAHIQPIFDRNCTSCHGQKEPAAGMEFTSRKVDHYNQSYRTLFGLKPTEPTPTMKNGFLKYWYPDEPSPTTDEVGKAALTAMMKNEYEGQLVSIAGRSYGAEVTEPRQFGTAKSALFDSLLKHRDKGLLKMPQEDWLALATWVDLNAQYWGTYVDKDRYAAKADKAVRRVRVIFPSPWEAPPAGDFYWASDTEVRVRPLGTIPPPDKLKLQTSTNGECGIVPQ